MAGDVGGGLWQSPKLRRPHQPMLLYFPSPTPRKFQIGEMGAGEGCSPTGGARGNMPGKRCQGSGGHSPLLIFMSQEKVLHLLPSKIQFVVIIAFDSLGLVHRVIQRQEKLLKGLHHWWRHS